MSGARTIHSESHCQPSVKIGLRTKEEALGLLCQDRYILLILRLTLLIEKFVNPTH